MTNENSSAKDKVTSPELKEISSDSLFDNNKELIIKHSGKKYRLRITKQDKLILTK